MIHDTDPATGVILRVSFTKVLGDDDVYDGSTGTK
jgi:hypothetical protein